jgi:AbrB family looped-hinge helix DNA binding protein
MLVTVTDKGQLTVPKAIRDQFGIEPGSKLDFDLLPDGTLRVRVLRQGSGQLYGLLHKPGEKAKSIEQMDSGMGEAALSRVKRSRG